MPRMPAWPRASSSLSGVSVVDDGDAARVGAARLHAVDRRRIVGAVDAGRDDHHALDVKRLVQRRHLFGRSRLRRVDATGEERKFFRIAVNMGVAIAGARGHIEVHLRRGLGRFGKNGSVVHGYSDCNRAKQNSASRQHRCLLSLRCFKKNYCAGVASLSHGKAMKFLPEIDAAHFDAGLSIASGVTPYRSVRNTV